MRTQSTARLKKKEVDSVELTTVIIIFVVLYALYKYFNANPTSDTKRRTQMMVDAEKRRQSEFIRMNTLKPEDQNDDEKE